MEFPEVFEPLFLEREVEGDTYTTVDKWCVIFKRLRLWIVGVVAQAI